MGRVRVLAALAFAAGLTGGVYGFACSGTHAVPGADASASEASSEDGSADQVAMPYDGAPLPEAGHPTPVHAEFVSTPVRTDTMQLMFAAGEMQTSGEPFAQNFAGRNLYYYIPARYSGVPDQYWAPGPGSGIAPSPVIDLFGFSTAVESYEYSKYHMNMVANQSGAGVSLVNGPLIAALPGASPFDKLRARMEALIAATGADVTQFAQLPPPANNPLNDFGFAGLWPNLAPYRSFDATMAPSRDAANICYTDAGPRAVGYGGLALFGGHAVDLYECDYNSLHLSDRNSQSDHVIGPGIQGYATWKEALWAIDFTGRIHDLKANQVTAGLSQADMANVGKSGNTVQELGCPAGCQLVIVDGGFDSCPVGCEPGVFIGSTPLEGIWGLTMIEEIDNSAAWLLSSLATSDGAKLTGFASTLAAIQYDYNSPLAWYPTAIAVTEVPDTSGGPAQRYPAVQSLSIQDGASHSVDLAALAQGYSLFFGMTDARNSAVGQQIGAQVAFSGFPFAADDGQPDGEGSPHDRALGVMRVAFVDLDRMHVDPQTLVAVDTATVASGKVTRGNSVTTRALGHVVVGLRHLLMALNAAVSQYGAPDSDSSKDDLGILNSVPIHPPDAAAGAPPAFSARVRSVLMNQAAFVYGTLSQDDGTVQNGATLANGQWSVSTDATTIEAQSAALRVLVEAWFLTHDTKYQDRARSVARVLLTSFWSDPARMFRAQTGGPDDIVMTPETFGWLQQALRETYEALWLPGDSLLDRPVLEDRIARVNKLYLNGWDDLNGDQKVEQPDECLGARMQLGEQILTGETATDSNGHALLGGPDVDHDCVLNIAFADAGSVLAGAVHFHAP